MRSILRRAVASLSAGVVLLTACGPDDVGDVPGVVMVFGETGLADGQLSYPRAMAVGPDDHLWIIDKAGRVIRFDADGEFVSQWKMPEVDRGKPTGLTVDADGNLWVADTHEHRVAILSPDGKLLRAFGELGRGDGQFIFPTDVALRGNAVYVGEYGRNDRIQVFDRDGTFRFSFAHRADEATGVARPQTMAFGPDDRLYVTDAGRRRVMVYEADGAFVRAFGQEHLTVPFGLCFLDDGTLVVSDNQASRVVRFSTDGEMLATWGEPGMAVGQLAVPWAVANWRGRLAILDSYNDRVVVLEPARAMP